MRDLVRGVRLVLSAALRADPRGLVTALVVWAVTSASIPLLGLWLKLVADGITRGDRAMAVAGAVAAGLSWVAPIVGFNHGMNVAHTACERTTVALNADLVALVGDPPQLEHHERGDHADRLALLREQRDRLGGVVYAVLQLESALVSGLVTLGLLGRLHPLLLALPLLALPSLAATAFSTRARERARAQTAPALRLAEHLFELATRPGPAKELKLFDLRDELPARHRALRRQVVDAQVRATRSGAVAVTAAWLLFGLGYLAAVGLVARSASQGRATFGDVLLTLTVAGLVNRQVAQIAWVVTGLFAGLADLRNYLWLVDYAQTATRAPTHAAAARDDGRARPPDRVSAHLRLEGVSFAYPGTDRLVLDSVDLALPAGTTVAIVGENGAGKTTLVKLLCRYYEPSRGRITLDGADLRGLDVAEWRAAISASFQDFVRLEALARESVGVGDLPRSGDPGAVEAALRRAGATGLPRLLPDGLDTPLGRSYTDGVEPSGGQWQQLALARGSMRQAPLLLVLDEPTSGLDAHAEHALFERYATTARRLGPTAGTITILVSHRFSTVRMADLIVVLEDGKLVEAGTHTALVAGGGLYAELYHLQASAYTTGEPWE